MVLPVDENIKFSETPTENVQPTTQEGSGGLGGAICKIRGTFNVSLRTNAVFGTRTFEKVSEKKTVLSHFSNSEKVEFNEDKLRGILNSNNILISCCLDRNYNSNDGITAAKRLLENQTKDAEIKTCDTQRRISKPEDSKSWPPSELENKLERLLATKSRFEILLLENIQHSYIKMKFESEILSSIIEVIVRKNNEIKKLQFNFDLNLHHSLIDITELWLLAFVDANEMNVPVTFEFNAEGEGSLNLTRDSSDRVLTTSGWATLSDNMIVWQEPIMDKNSEQFNSIEESESSMSKFMMSLNSNEEKTGEINSGGEGGTGTNEKEEREDAEGGADTQEAKEEEEAHPFELISRSKNHILFISNGITYFFINKRMERKRKSKKKAVWAKLNFA